MYLDLLVDAIQKGQTTVDDISNHDVRLKVREKLAQTKSPKEITLKEIAQKLEVTPQAVTLILKKYPEYRIGRRTKNNDAPVMFNREVLKKLV